MTCQGSVVYAHYGRKKDYQYLLSRGIDVSGHIVLIRLGVIFRGAKVTINSTNNFTIVTLTNETTPWFKHMTQHCIPSDFPLFQKVDLAERQGAVGVILFSDRQDKTTQNHNFTYPDSWWLPGMGVEYGHVGRSRGGDLLTPFYPAISM